MKTHYYILKPAVDTAQTGNAYPAAETYDDYDFNAPCSVHNLIPRVFPDFEPDIRFKLAKRAKLTDMLSQAAISAHGFLISENLRAAFEQFNIVPHQYFPATVEDHKGNLHRYFWMHLVWQDWSSAINWEKSRFFVRRVSRNLGPIEVISYDDYKLKSLELGVVKMIDYEKIKFSREINFDIFTSLKSSLFASSSLKEEITPSLTGLSFELTEKLEAY